MSVLSVPKIRSKRNKDLFTYSGLPALPPTPPLLLAGEPMLLLETPGGEVVDRRKFLGNYNET